MAISGGYSITISVCFASQCLVGVWDSGFWEHLKICKVRKVDHIRGPHNRMRYNNGHWVCTAEKAAYRDYKEAITHEKRGLLQHEDWIRRQGECLDTVPEVKSNSNAND